MDYTTYYFEHFSYVATTLINDDFIQPLYQFNQPLVDIDKGYALYELHFDAVIKMVN